MRHLLLFLTIGYLSCSSCTYRMHDNKASIAFDNANIPITFKDFTTSGRTIHYAEVNTGRTNKPTLFFIHGSPASWHCYDNYMQDTDLVKKFRIISIDRPGFGFSDFGEATTVTEQAALVGTLVASLQNGQPFYVIGHSLGGPVAVKVAAAHSTEVNGLVILAGAVSPGGEHEETWRRLLMPVSFAMPTALQTCNREIWSFKKDVQTIPADLHAIKCPVFIFQGLSDNMVPPENGYFAQQNLTSASSVKLHVYEGVHHDIPWTRFEDIKVMLMELK